MFTFVRVSKDDIVVIFHSFDLFQISVLIVFLRSSSQHVTNSCVFCVESIDSELTRIRAVLDKISNDDCQLASVMFLSFFEIKVNDFSKIIVFHSHVYVFLRCSYNQTLNTSLSANSMIKSSFEVTFSVSLFDSLSRLRSSESSLLEKVIAAQEECINSNNRKSYFCNWFWSEEFDRLMWVYSQLVTSNVLTTSVHELNEW